MNTPVSFPIAKLLKEKGFDKKVLCCYNIDNGKLSVAPHHELSNFNAGVHYSAPTIADVVMWLYEKHGIWIEVYFDGFKKNFYIVQSGEEIEFNSPTEAYEAAIEYCLINLI